MAVPAQRLDDISCGLVDQLPGLPPAAKAWLFAEAPRSPQAHHWWGAWTPDGFRRPRWRDSWIQRKASPTWPAFVHAEGSPARRLAGRPGWSSAWAAAPATWRDNHFMRRWGGTDRRGEIAAIGGAESAQEPERRQNIHYQTGRNGGHCPYADGGSIHLQSLFHHLALMSALWPTGCGKLLKPGRVASTNLKRWRNCRTTATDHLHAMYTSSPARWAP